MGVRTEQNLCFEASDTKRVFIDPRFTHLKTLTKGNSMASIYREKQDPCWKIYFKTDGRRHAIRLNKKTPKTEVERVRGHIDYLERAVSTGTEVPVGTLDWLNKIDDKFFDKLTDKGLVEERDDWRLLDWMDWFIDESPARARVKESTTVTWQQARRHAGEYFTDNPLLRDLTIQDAMDFRDHLEHVKGLSIATARKRCSVLKQMIEQAVRAEKSDRNPFKAVKTACPRSETKDYVTPEMAHRISENLPNAEWRLVFALARYGGLRVPSEPSTLTWDGVDWENNRLTFRSPKTERYQGMETRTIPLFDSIKEPLLDVYEKAEPGEEQVLPWLYSKPSPTNRYPLLRAIKKAGYQPWPKLWSTLRACADHDMRLHVPGHLADRWTGHSARIAHQHYQTELEQRQYEMAIKALGCITQRKKGSVDENAMVELGYNGV